MNVFRVILLVVVVGDITPNLKIDQLPDRHQWINTHRHHAGNLQGPVIAEAYIPFPRRGVNINTQSADTGFSLEERHVIMGFRILVGNPQVKGSGLQYISFLGNDDLAGRIVCPGIQYILIIDSQVSTQVNIIGIGAEVLTVERVDHDGSSVDLFKDLLIGQYHVYVL